MIRNEVLLLLRGINEIREMKRKEIKELVKGRVEMGQARGVILRFTLLSYISLPA